MLFVRLVLSLVSSPRVQEESGRENMVLITVEAVRKGSKPPAAVSVRISTGERQSFGASAPVSTRTSSLRGRAEGSLVMLKGFLQNSCPHFSLDLLQRPPYACESWCQTSSTIGRGGGDVTDLSPILGGNATKIAPTGDIFDQPSGQMR